MKTFALLSVLVLASLMIPVHASPQNPAAPAVHPPATQPSVEPSSANRSPSSPDEKNLNPTESTLHKILYFPGWLGALATLIGILVVARLNRQWADRTVKIEAQKLLLEVNKQYASNPDLWAIYDVNFDKLPAEKQTDKKLREALRAVAFMKLNIFEIVFSVHPSGPEQTTWRAYFKDSLEKCTLVRTTLKKHANLYNENLLKVYMELKGDLPADKQFPDVIEAPIPAGGAAQFDEKTVKKPQALAAAQSDPGDETT